MNTGKQDKFAVQTAVSRAPIEALPQQGDLGRRQASYIHRRFGLRPDRARLVADLAFSEGRP